MNRLQILWCLLFTYPFIWFLYGICFDIFVWNELLIEGNVLNYVGAVLSLAFIFVGSRLGVVVNMPKMFKKHEIDAQDIEEQGMVEDDLLSILRKLKKEERSVMKRMKKIQFKIKEEIKNTDLKIQILKSEISADYQNLSALKKL
jgi:hypothetical protein